MPKFIAIAVLTGIRPLLVHSPASVLDKPKNTVVVPKDPPEVMAKKALYLDEKGRFTFPTRGVRASFMQGAKKSGLKFGKSGAFSILSSTFFPVEEWAIILDPETAEPHKNYEVYVTSVVIGKSRIPSGRPMWRKWMLRVPVELDNTRVPNIEEVCGTVGNIAGEIIGAGDDRILNVQTGSCGTHGSYSFKIEKPD